MLEGVRIRRARAEEGPVLAPLLTDLCRRSKAHWGYERDLLDRWASDLAITPDDIDRDVVLIAELGGGGGAAGPRVAGFSRISRGTGTHLDHPAPAYAGSFD